MRFIPSKNQMIVMLCAVTLINPAAAVSAPAPGLWVGSCIDSSHTAKPVALRVGYFDEECIKKKFVYTDWNEVYTQLRSRALSYTAEATYYLFPLDLNYPHAENESEFTRFLESRKLTVPDYLTSPLWSFRRTVRNVARELHLDIIVSKQSLWLPNPVQQSGFLDVTGPLATELEATHYPQHVYSGHPSLEPIVPWDWLRH